MRNTTIVGVSCGFSHSVYMWQPHTHIPWMSKATSVLTSLGIPNLFRFLLMIRCYDIRVTVEKTMLAINWYTQWALHIHITYTNAPEVYFNIHALAHLIHMHTLTCIREGAMIHMEFMSFGPHSIQGQGMQYFCTASRTAAASFSPSSFRSTSSARMHSCPCAVDVQMKWRGYMVLGGSLAGERGCIKNNVH